MKKYVYTFPEGSREKKDLLGGKGANLAEMHNTGLPVPPGFTIHRGLPCSTWQKASALRKTYSSRFSSK